MIRRVLVGPSAAALLVAWAAFYALSGEAASARGVKVLCFGDSITFGYAASDEKSTSYPAFLQKMLDSKHAAGAFEVTNAGISGEDTRQGLARIDSTLKEHAPKWVLILYGTNDLWTARKLAPSDTEANLKKIIAHVKASGATPILSTIIPVWDDDARVAARNESIRKVAAAEGVRLVDQNAAFEKALAAAGDRAQKATWEKYYKLEDNGFLHPNDDGDALMAKVWFEALEAAMTLASTTPASVTPA
jgi:lysophospholipase L1-like esterase